MPTRFPFFIELLFTYLYFVAKLLLFRILLQKKIKQFHIISIVAKKSGMTVLDCGRRMLYYL